MLALSRKVGQTILIDQNIIVKVLSIHGSRITLGFSAPEDVTIRRVSSVHPMPSVETLAATASLMSNSQSPAP